MISKLQLALEEIRDNEDFNFKVHSYSGRFMYGKECLAITGEDIDVFELGIKVGQWGSENDCLEEIVDEVAYSSTRQDNMGLGIVIYWTRIPFEKREEEEEEEEEKDGDDWE
jgi:hypothetical protein